MFCLWSPRHLILYDGDDFMRCYSLNYRWPTYTYTLWNWNPRRGAQMRNYLRIFKRTAIQNVDLNFDLVEKVYSLCGTLRFRMYLRSHFGILLLSVVQSYLGFVFHFLFVRCLCFHINYEHCCVCALCFLECYLRRRTHQYYHSSYLVEFLQMFLSVII